MLVRGIQASYYHELGQDMLTGGPFKDSSLAQLSGAPGPLRYSLAISTRARASDNDRDLTHALKLRKML
jgi:hypothetical protein